MARRKTRSARTAGFVKPRMASACVAQILKHPTVIMQKVMHICTDMLFCMHACMYIRFTTIVCMNVCVYMSVCSEYAYMYVCMYVSYRNERRLRVCNSKHTILSWRGLSLFSFPTTTSSILKCMYVWCR